MADPNEAPSLLLSLIDQLDEHLSDNKMTELKRHLMLDKVREKVKSDPFVLMRAEKNNNAANNAVTKASLRVNFDPAYSVANTRGYTGTINLNGRSTKANASAKLMTLRATTYRELTKFKTRIEDMLKAFAQTATDYYDVVWKTYGGQARQQGTTWRIQEFCKVSRTTTNLRIARNTFLCERGSNFDVATMKIYIAGTGNFQPFKIAGSFQKTLRIMIALRDVLESVEGGVQKPARLNDKKLNEMNNTDNTVQKALRYYTEIENKHLHKRDIDNAVIPYLIASRFAKNDTPNPSTLRRLKARAGTSLTTLTSDKRTALRSAVQGVRTITSKKTVNDAALQRALAAEENGSRANKYNNNSNEADKMWASIEEWGVPLPFRMAHVGGDARAARKQRFMARFLLQSLDMVLTRRGKGLKDLDSSSDVAKQVRSTIKHAERNRRSVYRNSKKYKVYAVRTQRGQRPHVTSFEIDNKGKINNPQKLINLGLDTENAKLIEVLKARKKAELKVNISIVGGASVPAKFRLEFEALKPS